MTASVVVRQYRTTEPIALSPAALQAVLSNHRNDIDVLPTPDGRYQLRGTRWVGVIRLPDIDLLITPKVPPLSVFWMLGRTQRIAALKPPDTSLGVEPGILDALASAFATEVRMLVHRGLHREYVEREERLAFVRGRLLISETIRTGRGLSHRPVSRFTELTANTPHNQALRSATEMLSRFRYETPGLDERLRWNLLHLSETDAPTMTARDVETLQTNRLNNHYRPALSLAALVLRHVTFEFASGGVAAPSFLVNMDAVYEEYLSRLLGSQAGLFGLRIRERGGLYLDQERRVAVNPDIVLADDKGLVRAVFDAKYKIENPEADVYQALAYAKALGLQRVLLVYPEDGEVTPIDIRVRHDDIEVLVRTVPVGRHDDSFGDLDSRANDVARTLIEESLGDGGKTLAA